MIIEGGVEGGIAELLICVLLFHMRGRGADGGKAKIS
jgi:hypothetical protein